MSGAFVVLACARPAPERGHGSSSSEAGTETGDEGAPAECGDGIVGGLEECDDQDADDADGCKKDCTRTRVDQVEVGIHHACALSELGTVRCWGEYSAALGLTAEVLDDGDLSVPGSLPEVRAGGQVAELSAGGLHTCARLSKGGIRCWGTNEGGQLGQGHTEPIGDDEHPDTVPAFFEDLDIVQMSSAFESTCALDADGALRCWGSGLRGQLGYGDSEPRGWNEPLDPNETVDFGRPLVEIDAGDRHYCARDIDGAVWCWGDGGSFALGMLGDENIGDDETPANVGPVELDEPAIAVAAGKQHSCAVLESGRARCWGRGWQGPLGYGNEDDVGDDEFPIDVGFVSDGAKFEDILAGSTWYSVNGALTCGMIAGGLLCWGANEFGQLGQGNTSDIGDDEIPTVQAPIALGGTVESASIGARTICAVTSSGEVFCWGGWRLVGHDTTDDLGDDEPPTALGPVQVFPE